MRPRTHGIAAAVFVLVLAYTGYWFMAAAWLRDGVEDWAGARRAEGFAVGYDDLEVSGFPFRLAAELTAPRIGKPGAAPAWTWSAWTWSADSLLAEVRPWAFDRVAATLPAEQRLSYRRPGGAEQVVTASVQRGVVVFEVGGGGALDYVSVETIGAVVTTPRGAFRFARLDGRGGRALDSAVDLAIDVEGASLPPGLYGGLGGDIARFAAEATVVGAWPASPPGAALAAWSAAGGLVELKALALRWGGLGASASGTLTVDRELRPLAALTAEIEGYAAVLEALAAGGLLTARDAAFTTTALNLLAKRGPDGRRVLRVSVTAQDGTLFVGPLALVKLGPIALQ